MAMTGKTACEIRSLIARLQPDELLFFDFDSDMNLLLDWLVEKEST
jgi:hypothetical protein